MPKRSQCIPWQHNTARELAYQSLAERKSSTPESNPHESPSHRSKQKHLTRTVYFHSSWQYPHFAPLLECHLACYVCLLCIHKDIYYPLDGTLMRRLEALEGSQKNVLRNVAIHISLPALKAILLNQSSHLQIAIRLAPQNAGADTDKVPASGSYFF